MMLLVQQEDALDLEQDDLSAESIEPAERRRGLRIRQSRPVKILDPVLGRFFGGETQDISATGLRLELPADANLRVGSTLNIHVGLSPTGNSLANRRSLLPVRVVWVRRGRSTSQTLTAGVELATTIGAQREVA